LTFEELNSRYGSYISQRLRQDLLSSELDTVEIEGLPQWLEERAEKAHKNYLMLLNNPILSSMDKNASSTGLACRRWRDAEDLAYLVAIAETEPVMAAKVG